MKVEQGLLKLWQDLLDKGDIKLISEESGIHHITIGKALNGDDCSERTLTAINDFMGRKQTRINESAAQIKKAS